MRDITEYQHDVFEIEGSKLDIKHCGVVKMIKTKHLLISPSSNTTLIYMTDFYHWLKRMTKALYQFFNQFQTLIESAQVTLAWSVVICVQDKSLKRKKVYQWREESFLKVVYSE